MTIIHGSTGLIYFVHEWQPKFQESALLSDPEMYAVVTRINRRIQMLAPVLNGPTIRGGVVVESSHEDVPVAVMTKRHEDVTYVFAVGMRAQPTRAQFTVSGLAGIQRVDVLDEGRTLESTDGVFADEFAPWDVHLYRIGRPKGR